MDQQERIVWSWESLFLTRGNYMSCLCVGFMNENEPGIIHLYRVEYVHDSRLYVI